MKPKKLSLSTKTDWLEARRKGVTGTDASVICGVNKWKSPYRLWCEKTGRLAEEEVTSPAAEWGIILEPVVRDYYARTSGRKVIPPEDFTIYQHPEYEWMLGTIDGLVEDPDLGRGIYEGKTAGFFALREWEEEPPVPYMVQGQHYLAIFGYDYVTFAALIGGQTFITYDVHRNDEFIKTLIQHEKGFMELVRSGKEPPLDGSASTEGAIKAMLQDSVEEKEIEFPEEAIAWDRDRVDIDTQIRELQNNKRLLDNKIKHAIGDAVIGTIPQTGVRYSWRPTKRKGTRQLRRVER